MDAVYCGPIVGDILHKNIKELPLVQIIIAGPPCPPWSSKGARRSWEDNRSVPFWRTLEIIVHQAHSGILLFFVIENVIGFTQVQADGSVPLDDVLQLLREELPAGWTVDVNILNSEDFALPQKRTRVYITGRKTSPGALGSWGHGPDPIKPFQKSVFLCDVVSLLGFSGSLRAPFGQDGRGYSSVQRSNLRQWRAALSHELSNKANIGQCVVIAYDRTPSSRTGWVPTWSRKTCECLTATGPVLHCLSLGDNAHSRNSSLLIRERAAMQGYPLGYICDDHMAAKAVTAIGNAMSVPVLAAVCFRELRYQIELRPRMFIGTGDSLLPRIQRIIMEKLSSS